MSGLPLFERRSETLLLALGNDLLGDDGVGLMAARALRPDYGDSVDILECGEAGLALVELLEGYRRAILLDAVVTGRKAPGAIIEFTPADFQTVIAPSPHYAGLPEALELARRLGVAFPEDLRILALEVENPYEFRENELTPPVAEAFPAYVRAIRAILDEWKATPLCTNTP